MPGSVLKGRRWGGGFLNLFTGVCLFVFPYLLFGSVARCQSTSSHGARRRLTFVQPTHGPAKPFLNKGCNTVSDKLDAQRLYVC